MVRTLTTRIVHAVALTVLATMTAGACSLEESDDVAAAVTSSCDDGVRNGDELGVDCGGPCKKCTGESCESVDDCRSNACNEGLCAPPEGKTCGVGLPTACEDGLECEQDNDCLSRNCHEATCGPRDVLDSASNGQQDNGETDVDCGGPNAPPCADGKSCEADLDCENAYCREADKTCATPRADDGVKNGTETDVDCGGQSGVKCVDDQACLVDSDCVGVCNYKKRCVHAPSCRPHIGGDTCGLGEVGAAGAQHESCCRTVEVKGFTDPAKPGKRVFLDKYEVTAGRVRAFIEDIVAKRGAPDVKGWLTANEAPLWHASWSTFLPSNVEGPNVALPNSGLGNGVPSPANLGLNYIFGSVLYVYVHGSNCYQGGSGSYGYPTFWYPPDVMTMNGGHPRFFSKEELDVKAMTCIPNAVLAAFCHWDGGQLATDEVLDFVTGSPLARPETTGGGGLGERACGCTGGSCNNRCPLTSAVNAIRDAGNAFNDPYRYFYPTGAAPGHEGVQRIAPPGRMAGDRVVFNGGEWADLGGNLNEVAIDTTDGVTQGRFTLKYRGIGFRSARLGGNRGNGNAANPIGTAANPARFSLPEYKAAYSGGRCMRYRD